MKIFWNFYKTLKSGNREETDFFEILLQSRKNVTDNCLFHLPTSKIKLLADIFKFVTGILSLHNTYFLITLCKQLIQNIQVTIQVM